MSLYELNRGTAVDALVEALAAEIFTGAVAPGEKLAPLRALSTRHGVTVPTVQRAIARLEEMGLVAVRHGSGITALAPERHARPAALPYRMIALLDRPEEARQVLDDFLELRRDLAALVAVRVRPAFADGPPAPYLEAVDALRRLADAYSADERGVTGFDDAAFAAADIDVVRSLLAPRPQIAYASIFSVFKRLMLGIGALREAMYDDPASHVLGYEALAALLASPEGDDEVRRIVDAMLADFDRATSRRFVAALRARTSADPDAPTTEDPTTEEQR
jgi:DNA-binding FadR family transcriptional regulator